MRQQQQVDWRRTGIDFAKMFGQLRPEDVMLSEEATNELKKHLEKRFSNVIFNKFQIMNTVILGLGLELTLTLVCTHQVTAYILDQQGRAVHRTSPMYTDTSCCPSLHSQRP